MVRTKEGLRRACPSCLRSDETGLRFRQTSQYSRDLMAYRREGENLWSRFNGGKQGALWYYRALVDTFSGARRIQPLAQEIDRVLTELELLSNKGIPVKAPPSLRKPLKSRTS